MSCSACTQLLWDELHVLPHDEASSSSSGVKPHHDDVSNLCQAALAGCRICLDLWRYFFKDTTVQEYAAKPMFEYERTVHLYFRSGTSYRFLEPNPDLFGKASEKTSLILEFMINSPMNKDVVTKRFIFEKLDDEERFDNDLGSAQMVSTSSGYMRMIKFDERVFEKKRWNLVQNWMEACSSSHPTCQMRYRSPDFFPSRLIYIPFGPLALEPRYYLIDTKSHPPTDLGYRYVTLSHCWGKLKEPPYRTTPQNIARRLRDGIYRSDLPPTFTDAIDTALRLRAPFLWIDSLCIIQGDGDDWAVECTKMADVYMNATLNISATSGSSSQDGLTSSYELHPRIINTMWPGGRSGTYRLIDPEYWRERVTNAEINSRGWVMQERFLAPRVLHFGFDQLLWECCELSASEEFPHGMPSYYTKVYAGGKSDFKQTTNLLHAAQGQTDPVDRSGRLYRKYHDIWRELCNMYGRCELSQPDKDKLMAISGVAKTIQRELKDEYLAGLWKSNLIGDLLWNVHMTQRVIRGTVADGLYRKGWDFSKRAAQYRAPSWSWASVDGLIRLGGYLDLSGKPQVIEEGKSTCEVTTYPLAHILNTSVSMVVPDDPFGQVYDGKLTVLGQLHRLASRTEYRHSTTIFQATGEMVFDSLDEPVSWDIYKEAYFLPLVLTERSWIKLSQELSDSRQTIRDLSKNLAEINIETTPSQEGETIAPQTGVLRGDSTALQKDRDDFSDTVAGIEICPTVDRKAFKRIARMELSIAKFRNLGGCLRLDELHSDSDDVCAPDAAVVKGNMITGVFEIV